MLAEFKPLLKRKRNVHYAELYHVEDFLNIIRQDIIRQADAVFTASYHGMLFSIYFHRYFEYANKDRSRLQQVASMFHLEDQNINTPAIKHEPDWNEVDRIRRDFAERSLEILKEDILN